MLCFINILVPRLFSIRCPNKVEKLMKETVKPKKPKKAHALQEKPGVITHIERKWLLVLSLAMHWSGPQHLQTTNTMLNIHKKFEIPQKNFFFLLVQVILAWADLSHSHNYKCSLMLARPVGHQAHGMQTDCHGELCFPSQCCVCSFRQWFTAKHLWTLLPGREDSPPTA